MPTGLRNQCQPRAEGVWLGGCENCESSPLALDAYRDTASDPAYLFQHWNAHDPSLTRLIAERYHVSPEQVFVTAGAYGALEALAFLCFHPGVRVGLRVPDWPGFSHFVEMAEATEISLRMETFPFCLPIEQLIGRLGTNRADACLIANPSATQGFEYTTDEIERLCLSNRDRLIIIDEADSIAPERSAASLSTTNGNLMAIGSFSKLYGLSGMRIGWLIVPPEWIAATQQVIGPCTTSGTAVVCAMAAIQDLDYLTQTKRRVAESLEAITAACEGSQFQAIGYDGCFACFLSPRELGGEDPYSYLSEKGIWLNPAETFGLPTGTGGRLNLSCPAKVIMAARAIRGE